LGLTEIEHKGYTSKIEGARSKYLSNFLSF